MTTGKGESAKPESQGEALPPAQVHRIIVEGDAGALVECAKRIGGRLAEAEVGAKSLRALLASMHVIELTWPIAAEYAQQQIVLLKPKIAYLAKKAMAPPGTQESAVIEELWQTVSNAIDIVKACPDELGFDQCARVTRSERQIAFVRLMHFLEAILAYHKYYGGTD